MDSSSQESEFLRYNEEAKRLGRAKTAINNLLAGMQVLVLDISELGT